LDPELLRALLATDLTGDRLAAVAELCGAAGDAELIEPVEKLARSLIESIEGTAAVEAFTRLVEILIDLDVAQGRRLGALASMIFSTRREDETRVGFYPFRRLRPE